MKALLTGIMLLLGIRSVCFGQQPGARSEKQVFHWLALGDSYTIGESVTANERYPAQTALFILTRSGKETQIDYIAATGWTSAVLQQAIAEKKPDTNYDCVTLLIGVNDQYQGLDTGGYRKRFIQLLQTALHTVQGKKEKVWVISIPDYSATPFGKGSERIRREIAAFNQINFDIVGQYQVRYCNITGISQTAASDPALTAADQLHPSGKQYHLWAIKLADQMNSLFQ